MSASLFRVSWRDSLGSGWDEGTMLYERRKSQLRYFDKGGDDGGYYQLSYVFSGVKDATFQGLLRFNSQQRIRQLLPFSFLQTLPELGYKQRQLKKFLRGAPNAVGASK